jgi:hypothetical protein
MRWSILVVVSLLTLACTGPTGPDTSLYRFTLASLAFGEGDLLVGQLLNSTSQPVRYDFCGNVFQRRAGSGWEPATGLVSPPEEVACPAGMQTLEPGALVYFRHRVLAALPSAEYRLQTVVEVPTGQQRELVTPSFQVAR